jgi:hypothetical protein
MGTVRYSKSPLKHQVQQAEAISNDVQTYVLDVAPQRSPTLGHLVEVAYNKNTQLVNKKSLASVGKLLLQQQLWTRLQGTFFAPGADAAVMCKQSALSFQERHIDACV